MTVNNATVMSSRKVALHDTTFFYLVNLKFNMNKHKINMKP